MLKNVHLKDFLALENFDIYHNQKNLILVQFLKNGGKCGVCGDNWQDPKPRPHEGGGRYGQGVIGRRYTTGQVNITINHFCIDAK